MMKVNKDFENENGKLKCDCAFIDCQCINEIKKEVAREIIDEFEDSILHLSTYGTINISREQLEKVCIKLKKKYIGE